MNAPVTFRLACFMIRHHIRGGHRLLALMRPHWRNRTVDYKLSPALDFTVPIGRPENCCDLQALREYESEFLSNFCVAIRSLQKVTLFDCGADIGLFSASVCARSGNIARVLAFEPNCEVQDVLLRNLSRLPGGESFPVAVSDFGGYGKLVRPDYDASEHARYLAKTESGIPVITIDSLGIRGGDITIKIDVEGGELAVLRGASETIRSAHAAVVAFESHPDVVTRTGVHPRDCLKLLAKLAPFRFVVAETNEQLNADSPKFPDDRIVNIVGSATVSCHLARYSENSLT